MTASTDPDHYQPSAEKGDTTPVIDVEHKSDTTPAEKDTPREISGWKWAVIIGAIYSSQFLFALDNTIVANIQPTIVEDFDAIAKLSWISVAFLIGAASTNLVWGKIFAQFNAKWTYILCICIFEIGSAVCGAAPNINAFIIARAICGFSGAGMYVGLMTMIAVTTTLPERPMYIGGAGFTWGIGTVLGPIIGGAFTDSSAGWRWSFYINLCIGAVCAPVYFFMLPNKDPRPGVSFLDRARELDYIGGILTIGAFVSGVMAISFGGATYAWNSGQIIGLFCCSGVLFILLGIQQALPILTTVPRRLFPVEFFKSRTILILFAMTAAGGASIFLPVYMTPIFFQYTRGDSALESGVKLLPFIAVMIVAVIGNGAILSSHGMYMPWYLAGGILVLIGGALMFTVDTTTSVAHIYGYTILIGFGVGIFSQASFSVAQAVVAPHMAASAVGFISCAQISGSTIALSIANCLFLNQSIEGIHQILPDIPTSEIEQTVSGTGSALFDSLTGTARDEVLEALVEAINNSYILVMTAGALVTVLSLLMKRERLFISGAAVGA
ncbi:MFS general substrate transporter [Aspergillus heteromorphus CBS 117.55]|uniref:MFS general substrate transporter n=1 Tax=Aspergillus heteromorphus CBS 117.55 TaxID=1448321 RepID=A0A317W117_9EURO|nr:MFS general substrate transporter [Aspergillus heteromorphus CBS 117.55]PWY79291.1 MFS general substrate transporter [Aspergillus heteromorphus CBS 117.55]